MTSHIPHAPAPVDTLPDGVRWDAERRRLKVLNPALADIVLRDPHIITGVDRSSQDMAKIMPGPNETPTVTQFFELWYTVGDNYATFNTELRKAFATRVVERFDPMFAELADRHAAAMPDSGDLARDYLSPYFMHSTFAMLGVPEREWPNLAKVAKLVIYLFKQQLLGVTEHPRGEVQAFHTVMSYLKSVTDDLLTGSADSPFLTAARSLSTLDKNTWPIAALVGQLLMAGIEPMIVGTSIACRNLYADPNALAALRDGDVSSADVAEEVLRQNPPFGNIFRFVHEPCDCLGVALEPGTIVAIDIAGVNLALAPADEPRRGCPVKPSSVLTFGKGTHYCLGANSARLQVAQGVRSLVSTHPDLRIDEKRTRIDTHNNLKEVRSLPYRTGEMTREETR